MVKVEMSEAGTGDDYPDQMRDVLTGGLSHFVGRTAGDSGAQSIEQYVDSEHNVVVIIFFIVLFTMLLLI